MKTTRHSGLHTVIFVAFALAGCSQEQAPPTASDPASPGDGAAAAGALNVYVTNYPLEYFARRIAGERAQVTFPVPAGGDPAYWSPSAEEIERLQQADVIFVNGATFERWLDKVSLPESKLVDTSSAFRDRYLQLGDAVVHSHGAEGEHTHSATDFTTWLDPQQAVLQAQAIERALAERLPESADALGRNFAALKTDLESLAAEIEEINQDYGGRPLLASHPVYGYLARFAGWDLESVHWEPEIAPEPAEWEKLDALLADHPAKLMLWEAEPDAETAAKLQQRGIRPIVFYTCGNVPPEGDYLETMRANLARVKQAFAP